MKSEARISNIEDLDLDHGKYTFADYRTWDFEARVELIKGKIFRFGIAAPKTIHQKISGVVSYNFYSFLKGKPSEIYSAPFDVRLPVKSKKNEDIDTVVQPDICVICDPAKLDDAGCIGAPDLIVEILSPGNNRKELRNKYEVYEESGVREYWIINPDEQTVMIYTLKEGKYQPSRLFTSGDIVNQIASGVSDWTWKRFFWISKYHAPAALSLLIPIPDFRN